MGETGRIVNEIFIKKVTVEVTEFSGGKERKRMFAKVKNCLDKMSSLPLPSHYAQVIATAHSII